MNAPRCLRRLLERQWRQGGWLSTLLRPLAALTGLVVARKRNAY
ncbi:tetraacyldisaccharide 4'-kinase, partial [Bordetella pertussis]